MDYTERDRINESLRDLYGNHVEALMPRFRVSWSEDRKIRRFGTFEDWQGDIFIREVSEIREVNKYPLISDRWIIERLIPNINRESDEYYVYEMLYAFPSDLPLSERAVKFFLAHVFKRVKGQEDPENQIPKTQKEADYQEEKKLQKEKEFVRDSLELTVLQTTLHDGSATVVPGFRDEVKKNGSDVSINPPVPVSGGEAGS